MRPAALRRWGALLAIVPAGPADAQGDPVAVARAFMAAVRYGDVTAIRALRTGDAVMVGGDVAIPFAEGDGAFAGMRLEGCTVADLSLTPKPFAAAPSDTLFPRSIRRGGGWMVEGTWSCPTPTGNRHVTAVQIVVADGKVALFAFGR